MNTPKAPDPYQTAAAQDQSNQKAAITQQELNQTNQTNPYGSLTYTQTGTNPDGTPKYSANTTLAPQTQALFDQYQKIQGGAGGVAQSFLNNGQGALSGKGPDLSYSGTTAALDALNKSRLDPQWAQNTDMQESKLANQGITPGTPAYDNAMRVFNQGKNDAYNSANLADYQTSSNNALAQWNAPLQAFGALTGASAPTMPNFMSTPTVNVPSTNIAGLINDNYKTQVGQNNAMMGGLFGLGGTLGGAALGGFGGMFGGGGALPTGTAIPGAYGPTAVGGPNGPAPLRY